MALAGPQFDMHSMDPHMACPSLGPNLYCKINVNLTLNQMGLLCDSNGIYMHLVPFAHSDLQTQIGPLGSQLGPP